MTAKDPGTVCPLGSAYQRYWDLLSRRERLLRFDEYGLSAFTPRSFSAPILEKIQGRHIVDACCSIGGMAIALADIGKRVTAVELHAHRLALARENARIFGVQDRIEFIRGDILAVLPGLKADTVFFDGQWASHQNHAAARFALADFAPDGNAFLETCFSLTSSLVLRVPANFDFDELSRFERQYAREATLVDGTEVAHTVYFGH